MIYVEACNVCGARTFNVHAVSQIDGRLLPMLERVRDLTLDQLNYATQAWVEMEYHRKVHDETRPRSGASWKARASAATARTHSSWVKPSPSRSPAASARATAR